MGVMKIIFGLILGLCLVVTGKAQILLGTDIAVNISVEVANPQVKEIVSKDLSKILQTLNNDIVIVGGESSYLVKLQVLEIKSSPTEEPKYVISTFITTKEYAAPRRTEPAALIDQFLGHNLVYCYNHQLTENIREIAVFADSQIQISETGKYLRRRAPSS
jgi:hypothetical protein